VSWVTFEAAAGGLVVVQVRHVVALYDEGGEVKLATAAGGVHSLKDISVRRAAAMVASAEEVTPIRPEP
jgi:hypothetical protein